MCVCMLVCMHVWYVCMYACLYVMPVKMSVCARQKRKLWCRFSYHTFSNAYLHTSTVTHPYFFSNQRPYLSELSRVDRLQGGHCHIECHFIDITDRCATRFIAMNVINVVNVGIVLGRCITATSLQRRDRTWVQLMYGVTVCGNGLVEQGQYGCHSSG